MDVRPEPFNAVYEVCDDLGSGQYAEVQLCRKKSSTQEEKFAAKHIYKSGQDFHHSGVDMATIRNEVAILKTLHHEHIVRLYDVFQTCNVVTIILEYIEGGEFFAFLAEKDRLDEDEASGFVRQIVLGVEYIHSQCVIHLDLKPENIMLDASSKPTERGTPRIKIIDFGLAQRCAKGRTISVEPRGTPEFISPEVLACEPVSFSADMWTIGVIIFLMLTGSNPFAAATDAATFRLILSAKFKIDASISDLAVEVISKLLVRSPNKRLCASETLNHSWCSPINEQHATQRKQSVMKRENLEKLKQYVGAKQRWRSTIDLITLINHLSHSATGKTNHFLPGGNVQRDGNARGFANYKSNASSSLPNGKGPIASKWQTEPRNSAIKNGAHKPFGNQFTWTQQLRPVPKFPPSAWRPRSPQQPNFNDKLSEIRERLKPVAWNKSMK